MHCQHRLGAPHGTERPDRSRRAPGPGPPACWAHEITALHGLDHAQTWRWCCPPCCRPSCEQKRAKLLQYAERVWDLRSGSDEERIDGAIAATRDSSSGWGSKTRLRDYVADARIDALLAKPRRARHGRPGVETATSTWPRAGIFSGAAW